MATQLKRILVLTLLAGLLLGAVATHWLFRSADSGPAAASHRGMTVLRTPGGLLEVSTITTEERFDSNVEHKVLGVPVGNTVAQIRVPVVYRYHVALAPDWDIRVTDDAVIAIAPAVRPSLPVAIDTNRLEAFSAGLWSHFTGHAVLADLQRSITAKLNERAGTVEKLAFQRESARLTVTEFVRKWVVEQGVWKSSRKPAILVFFADEPLARSALPLLAP